MAYLVIQCKNCGQKQVKQLSKDITKSILKCVYCNKTSKLHDKRTGMFNLNILGLNKNLTEPQAREVLKEWKNENNFKIYKLLFRY